ncbi:hypothetical protein KC349_g289 [Hortaea werneckii]|nr:hypothetical protein KC349_g289 [Hortaea werneckii]
MGAYGDWYGIGGTGDAWCSCSFGIRLSSASAVPGKLPRALVLPFAPLTLSPLRSNTRRMVRVPTTILYVSYSHQSMSSTDMSGLPLT